MVHVTTKCATCWFLMQCCVHAVSVVWWPSGSGQREIGDFPINESSVALT